jgi:VWFA-related protein
LRSTRAGTLPLLLVASGGSMSTRILLGFAFLFACLIPSLSQTETPSGVQQNAPEIRTTTREVVLDLVVRDKHHHAVTDLKPEEVEVYEDGVRQNVRAFRNIQGSEQLQTEHALKQDGTSQVNASSASSSSASALVHPLNSMRQLNFVSVVFAQIAPLNLEFARRAVSEFLKSDDLPNTYVTIYKLDLSLRLMQPYTEDKNLLAKAVDTASKGLSVQGNDLGSSAAITSSNLATLEAWASNIMASPNTGPAQTQAVSNVLSNPIPSVVLDPLWAANAAAQDVSVTLGNALLTQADLVKGLRLVTSEVNGMDAMDSLHALVKSEERLPGRKVVLYLADGLTFPVNRREVVDDLISYANRAGVSFYTIDTRGLNTEDPMMEGLAAQKRTAAESSAQATDPQNGHFEDDDVQLTAASNHQLAMRELAESTGGFAVTNTNEIALPMQHMMEDMRTHYELAYSPTSTLYDGHFRKIEVKVNRPKITVQTRKGYFAVPDLNGEPLQPFEMLALNSINASHPPADFPYQVVAMQFRPLRDSVEYEVTFEVPVSGLKAVPDAKTGKSHMQAALVALIHDSSGAVVGKVSRQVAREIPTSELSQAAKDRILYAEPVELRAGHYVVDAAVEDEQAGKTSVKRFSVFVAPGEDLALSSLGVVRKFEPVASGQASSGPFDIANGRITPTLADSVASGNPVGLYFVVYPRKFGNDELKNDGQKTDGPKVTLDLLQDGKQIARKPLNLGPPEADGSIPMFVQLSPGPGQCDVLVTARQGTAVAQSALSLRVQ